MFCCVIVLVAFLLFGAARIIPIFSFCVPAFLVVLSCLFFWDNFETGISKRLVKEPILWWCLVLGIANAVSDLRFVI